MKFDHFTEREKCSYKQIVTQITYEKTLMVESVVYTVLFAYVCYSLTLLENRTPYVYKKLKILTDFDKMEYEGRKRGRQQGLF